MRKIIMLLMVAFAALALSATAAFAAYTFDPATGKGFVGKGDVQLIYGWNNTQLQNNAKLVDFRTSTTSETSWTCSRPAPTPNDPTREITQQRHTTTTTQGLATTVSRDTSKGKNGPVTGFNLTGYDSAPTVTTDGPAVGTCPAEPSGFTFDEGSEDTTTGATVLEVSINGTDWIIVPAPVVATVA